MMKAFLLYTYIDLILQQTFFFLHFFPLLQGCNILKANGIANNIVDAIRNEKVLKVVLQCHCSVCSKMQIYYWTCC